MTKFQKLRRALIERATDIYTDMRHDVTLDEYPSHFANMGSVIAQVDSHDGLASLIAAVCKGDFDILGLEPSCDETVEDFFKEVFG